MTNRKLLLVAGLFLAATTGACQDREPEPEPEAIATIPEAFPEVLLPPNGRLIASAGTSDALQLIFTSPVATEPVVAYYRERLGMAPWAIVGDTEEGDVTTIYAENRGRPMWVRIVGMSDGGSRIELNGAVLADAGAPAGVEGTPADSAAAPADSAPPDRPSRTQERVDTT